MTKLEKDIKEARNIGYEHTLRPVEDIRYCRRESDRRKGYQRRTGGGGFEVKSKQNKSVFSTLERTLIIFSAISLIAVSISMMYLITI